MPRKAKEKDIEDESIKEVKSKKSTAKSKPAATKKAETTAKEAVSKKVANAKTVAKKETAKKASTTEKKATTAKKTTVAKSASTTKKTETKTVKTSKTATASKSTKSTAAKKSSAKSTTKKAESAPKKATKTSEKKSTEKKVSTAKEPTSTTKKTATTKTASKEPKKSTRKKIAAKAEKAVDIKIIEYYDLPYKYGNTIVKLLAQTPNTLFVYWEISNEDLDSFKAKYGDDFFNLTKPVLIVHNLTLNKTTEVEVNDFANCWYLNTEEADCKYDIELARRFINPPKKSEEYLYIAKSNDLNSPNDHIMFEKLTDIVIFKNYKTNEIVEENITSFKFLRDIYKFYQNMYKDELLKNPSSKF